MALKTRTIIIWYSLVHFRPLERRLLVITIIGLAASVVSTIAGNTRLGLWLAVGTLLLDSMLFLVDLYLLPELSGSDKQLEMLNHLEYRDGPPILLTNLEPSQQEKKDGYATVALASSESVIRSNNVDVLLMNDKKIRAELRPKYENRIIAHWQEQWEDMQEFLILYAKQGKPLWNEEKLALCSPLESNTGVVHLGKTTYFTSIVTNEACTQRIKSESRIIRDLRNMFPHNEDGYILPVETSWMSNHIGISTVVITCDGHLILWKQKKGHQNLGKLMPTGSGSLDWSDARNSSDGHLLSIIKYGMAREIFEENGLDFRSTPISISELAKHTLIVGYYRWIRRGGKPEFVGITKVSLPLADFGKLNWEITGLDDKGHQLEIPIARSGEDLEDICNRYLNTDWLQKRGYQISTPLCVTMNCIRSGLQSSDTREKLINHCAFDKMPGGC